MSRYYRNSDYGQRGHQHQNGDQDRGKSSSEVAAASDNVQNGSRPSSTFRTPSTDSDGYRSIRGRSDDGRHNPRRADGNVWNESSNWKPQQPTENVYKPPPQRSREVTEPTGNSRGQENTHESRDANSDWKSSRNDRGGDYPRRQRDSGYKSGNADRDGFGREVPPRFRSNAGSVENDRRSESSGDNDRKYNSRQFYPKDDSRGNSNNERPDRGSGGRHDRGNGDWKRDNQKTWNSDSRKPDNSWNGDSRKPDNSWNADSRKPDNSWNADSRKPDNSWNGDSKKSDNVWNGDSRKPDFERKPRKYSNDENSKPKTSMFTPYETTLKKPELGQCSVEVGDYKKISVTYVVSPDEFYCNLVDHVNNERYLEMAVKLNVKCRDGYSLEELSNCSVGALCCACYSVDDEWYRARVVSVSGQDAQVFFIDYGNSDQCQVGSLKVLADEFQLLPARAIKCSLWDIRSATGKPWTVDEATHFENEVIQTTYLGHFKSKDASGAYVVDMIDSCLLNDLSLRYKLMDERDFRPILTTDSVYMEAASKSLSLNPYPKTKLDVDQAFTVFVTWVNTPGQFYGQLVEKESIWQDFESKLNSFYESKGENELVLTERGRGTACVAPYTFSGSKGWYRAFIIADDAEQSLVHYVDYGNTGLVAASEMKLVDPEFLDHPAQAILFSVSGIQPLGSQWEKVSQEQLAKYYSGDLECTVVKCTDDQYVVDVTARGKSVATELTSGGFAMAGDEFTLTVSPLIRKLACKLMSVEPEDHVVSPVEKFKVFETEPGPSTSAVPSTSSERAPVLTKAEAKELSVGDSFVAVVSIVKATSDFWVRRVTKLDEWYNLSAILQATYNDTDPEETLNLSPGDMCVARYSVDQCWYRAKVLGESDFGHTVELVDYGDVEWAPLDEIRAMPPASIEWVSEAPYAFACSLDGLPTFQDGVCPENVIQSFNRVLASGDREVEVTITKRIADKFCVKLTCQGLDVASVIAEECGLSLVSEEPKIDQFPVPEYKIKTIVKGAISYSEAPSQFWIQATDNVEKLAQLFDDLATCSTSADDLLLQDLKSGSVVLACYHLDNFWYRAIVNDVSEAAANVKFVDYGNCDDIQFDNLKTLPDKFISIPLMAIECKLHGVERPTQGWSTEVLDLFKTLESQGTELQVEIVDIVDGVFSVVLRDDDNNYNEMLTSQQTIPLDTTVTISTPTVRSEMIDFKLGEKVEAFISHIISPSEFWIQQSSDLEKIDNVSDELNQSCVAATGGHSSEMKFNVGELYAVQFSLDDGWYRGQLLEEKDGGFLTHFVDFGNSEVVSIERIVKLDKFDLTKLPFYATKCELSGRDGCSEWPEEAIETFKSDYDNKTCLAEFVSKKPQSYVVHLLDMGIDVAKKLLGDELCQSETSLIEDEPNTDLSSEIQNSVEVIRVESEESASSSSALYSTEVSSRSAVDESEVSSRSEVDESEVSSRSAVDESEVSSRSEVDESEDQETDISEVVSNIQEGAELIKDGVATEVESNSQMSKLTSFDSSVDASKDVSAEGFTSHLTIPTYSEFAEFAASHPGSVSQSPDSSMDRGNESADESGIISSTDVESSSDANYGGSSNEQGQWEVSSSTDAESKSFHEEPEVRILSSTGDAAKAVSSVEMPTEIPETTDFETEDASSCVDSDGDKSGGQAISDDSERAEGDFAGHSKLSTPALDEESDCQADAAAAVAVEDEEIEDGKGSGLTEAIIEAARLVPLQEDSSWSEAESDDSATIKNSSFDMDSKDGKVEKSLTPSSETNADLNQ